MIDTLNKVVKRVLSLDPEVRDAFAGLGNKVIEIRLTELKLSCYLQPSVDGLSLSSEPSGEVVTIIKGTLIQMMANALHQKLFGTYRTEGLSIEGDMELAQDFNRLMQQFSIDWEELLSKFIGDVAAHQMGEGVRSVGRWGMEAHESMAADISEYLQEEGRLLPAKPELEDFYAHVDELRDSVARCEARINRLIQIGK